MNIPNSLTLARMALAAAFMVALGFPGLAAKAVALGIFLTASATDYWDGRLARISNQVTPFGRLMDPIADKCLTVSAFVMFVQMSLVPAWTVVLIVVRDILITGMRLAMPSGGTERAAQPSGKHKTVLQLLFIVAVLAMLVARESAAWDPAWTPAVLRSIHVAMIAIVAITLWSGAEYAARYMRELH